MSQEKRQTKREGGPYMIQDHDHMSGVGQMGGETGKSGAKQADQSQGGSGQQGGQKSQRKAKLL